MTSLDLMLLFAGFMALVLLLLTAALLVMLWKTSQQNRTVILGLLHNQTSENQSLRNQLLSKDPYVLSALNSATLNSTSDDEYVPSYDEAHKYEYNLRNSEYTQTGLDHDLDAAGWEHTTVADTGGTPVTFGANS